ncbi:MAG: glycosyltransferase, partial [Hyphomicrobiales bacterium]
HYTAAWSSDLPGWKRLNDNAIREIGRRLRPDDFILLSGGVPHQPIAQAFPDAIAVEYGIGYNRTFAKYRVFESYAWMHMIYGAQSRGDAFRPSGHWFDAVIPSPVDMAQFPTRDDGEGYYLFIGRLIGRKGYEIAIDVCRELGETLIVAGPGEAPPGVRHVGVVGPAVRAHLMAGARAVFVPTIYIEPFGNVHAEAMACGTPVITTDWGVFTETVQQGVTGFRCRYFGEFLEAARLAPGLDRQTIRDYAARRFSLETVGTMYEDYFNRLGLLRGEGWASKVRAPVVPAPPG